MARIRTIKPDFWKSETIDPNDRQSWKRFGDSGAGKEFLYFLRDAAGRLLYVGITWNPFVRWTAHSKVRSWWREVSSADLFVCADLDARAHETDAIRRLTPLHNKHQNQRRAHG